MKSLAFMAQIILARLFGIHLVWTVHNLVNHDKRYPNLELCFSRILARLCDRLIVHSHYAMDKVAQAYRLPARSRKKMVMIPHGNFISSYDNTVTRQAARDRLGLIDERVYLFIGRIWRYKGVSKLVDTFRQLDGDELRLLVVGSCLDRAMEADLLVRRAADERIILRFQWVTDDQFQWYMNAADVVVLPFEQILTSGSVLLAMSFGKAVITPRIGCIAEYTTENGGFLYNVADLNGLRLAMAAARSADLDAIGRWNMERARSYGWKDIGGRTLSVYKDVLAQRSSSG